MTARDRYDPRGFTKFLRQEGLAEKVRAHASKLILAEDLRRQMKRKNMSLVRLSRQMRTTRAVVCDLLDPSSGGTIDDLLKACLALDLVFAIRPSMTGRASATRRSGSAGRSPRQGRKIVRRVPVAARERRS